MSYEGGPDHGPISWNQRADDATDDSGPRVERGARVRLAWLTWETLACAAVLVALCVAFGEDRPGDDGGFIALKGYTEVVETVRFSPNGASLATSSWDGSITLWEVDRATTRPEKSTAALPGEFELYAASFSPDGRTIAAAGMQGLTLWNWRDPQAFPKIKTEFGPCRSVAFSPDGRTLAVGGYDRLIRVYDLKADRVLAELSGHLDVIRGVTFSADGSLLLSQGFDGKIKFWDARENLEVVRIKGSTARIHTFELSPDGRTLALSRLGADRARIELWDLKTGDLKAACTGHEGGVHALAFAPDGGTLASVGADQTLRFWGTDTGKPTERPAERVGWVRALDVSSDGRWLAVSSTPTRVCLKRINFAPRPR